MPLPSFDPIDYATQLAEKLAGFKEGFAAFDLPEPREPFLLFASALPDASRVSHVASG